MDLLEFIQKSEWPVLVGGAIWFFRKQISNTLQQVRLSKAEILGQKFEFTEMLNRTQVLLNEPPSAAPASIQQPNGTTPTSPGDDHSTPASEPAAQPVSEPPQIELVAPKSQEVVVVSPEVVVQQAFGRLSTILREIYKARGARERSLFYDPPSWIGKIIGLSENEQAALRELESISYATTNVSNFTISPSDAARYVAMADDLAQRALKLHHDSARAKHEAEAREAEGRG